MSPPCEYDTKELPFRMEIMMIWKDVKFQEAARRLYNNKEYANLFKYY